MSVIETFENWFSVKKSARLRLVFASVSDGVRFVADGVGLVWTVRLSGEQMRLSRCRKQWSESVTADVQSCLMVSVLVDSLLVGEQRCCLVEANGFGLCWYWSRFVSWTVF